jgi:hypothetical protein
MKMSYAASNSDQMPLYHTNCTALEEKKEEKRRRRKKKRIVSLYIENLIFLSTEMI